MKNYNAEINKRIPRPRSKRLRELGISANSVYSIGNNSSVNIGIGEEVDPTVKNWAKKTNSLIEWDDEEEALVFNFKKIVFNGIDIEIDEDGNLIVDGNIVSTGGITAYQTLEND